MVDKQKRDSKVESVMEFHCPRYDELPDIDLYMDQVISILESRLSPVFSDENEKLISPSMVNNYVKQKVIPAPCNKKYSREHVAYLFSICILKKILTISEIQQLIAVQREKWDTKAAYDRFCDEVESAVKTASSGGKAPKCDEDEPSRILRSAALSFANRIYLERLISKMKKPKKNKSQK